MPRNCDLQSSHVAREIATSKKLKSVLEQSLRVDPTEEAASFGRWWLDIETGALVLSALAGRYLDVAPGLYRNHERCFSQVLPDDAWTLTNAFNLLKQSGVAMDCEIRVIDAIDGMRWLRMASLPIILESKGMIAGVVINVTATQQASVRERLGFASTQILVGATTESEAITEVIRVVCENLGWEWGAYWEKKNEPGAPVSLVCKHFWHDPAYGLNAFTRESRELQILPGEGVIGRVWRTGCAEWVESLSSPHDCLRHKGVVECGLKSGYAFPVSFVNSEGVRHVSGVLEFCSSLPRQREAQLPTLSRAIGELVAQAMQRIEQTETIQRMARTDEMTGLINRRHFYHLVGQACQDAESRETSFGVLYIDLDRFKPINDAYGHDVGNFLLIEFAKRLCALVPAGACVGRLGGDEFAILSPLNASLTMLKALAEKVLNAAGAAFQHRGVELSVSASIGISVYPENGTTTSELLRSSDTAMYRSKNMGGNLNCFYSGMMQFDRTAMIQQLTIESALHRALLKNEFFLEYQPVLDSFAEKIVAVEALIRWRRSGGEIVRPDVFIPIAEQSHLIVQIGRWVLKQACHDLAIFHRAGLAELQVNINMAVAEFTHAGLPTRLMEVINAAGIVPSNVCLELTEGMVMQHADDVIPIMEHLRKLGFHISLDDFGMGHSSLSRLKALPISSIKIDRSFVRGVPSVADDCAIVQTLFDLGHRMKLQIVAEGVETEQQLAYLRQYGYPLMQGYLLGRPMSAQALIQQYQPLASL